MTELPKLEDLDPVETREWLESIDSVLKIHGPERAHFLLERLIDYTRRNGAYLPFKPNTAYVNSIPVGREPEYPGNRALERRIEAYIRWNALVMVLLANKKSVEYRRTPLELRLLRDAVRSRLQSHLARTLRESPGRHALHPGALVAGRSTGALSSKVASAKSSCGTSARKPATPASGCRPIRTRG